MASKLAGFSRGGSFNRGYVTPEGKSISYRAYRNMLNERGLVSPLGPVELANARRRQREFNDIVKQMADVRLRSIDAAIENAEAMGDDELAEELELSKKTVKSEVIKSPSRKGAMKELKAAADDRETVDGVRRYKSPEQERRVKEALLTLGRREGIPDWVPVGMSGKFRSGKLGVPTRHGIRGRA